MATTKFTFWQLLRGNHVEIPIIQRDYAQGREGKEYLRKNFLASLKQALDGNPLKLDFVYGSVENNKLQPLDGQQRLTTLWLLHWYIALFADKIEEAFGTLLKFSYETRISTREFMQQLCNQDNFKNFNKKEDVESENYTDRKDIVKFIKEATWYYSEWNQDPTISSMLRMIKGSDITDNSGGNIIDGLDELFANTKKKDFERYWQCLTNTDAITFYQQPLEDFGLSDDLYVKMNARGKQLTSFENFKADLIGYLREQERDTENEKESNQKWKDLLDPQNGIPIRLDTEWAQLFWKNHSADYKIDEIFFTFINRFFWNELFTAKDNNGNYVLKLSSESKNSSYEYFNADAFDNYVGFEPYKFYMNSIPVTFFKKLQVVLDNYCSFQGVIPEPRWMEGFKFIPIYKNNKNEKEIEISGINQLQRIVFFAICKYFHEGIAEQSSLDRWMRVVYNLISGVDRTGSAEIRDVENVRKTIAYLDSLDSHNVISSLTSYEIETDEESKSSVLTRRWNEEIVKARQIKEKPDWEKRIIEAENYSFFHGSIRFLFQDENGKTDWGNFDIKWTSVKKFFTEEEEEQNSVMKESYRNAELLKTLFSRFTTDNFWENLWWNYRTFNNKANTWMYYLLSPDLCYPIHYLLLGYSRSNQWVNCSEDFAENTLYLLSHTALLDYIVSTKMSYSWIRNYRHIAAIYPSSEGIFLDAHLRDDFMLNTNDIDVDKDAKIPDTPLLFGWDINFRYKQYNFRWWRNDYVYLMEPDDRYAYAINNDGRTEEEKYFCFNADHLSKGDIISKLDELIDEYKMARLPKTESNEEEPSV